jgi:hypothetical protein
VKVSHPPSRVAAVLETPVGVLDEVLFGGKIGVLLRHGSYNSIGPFPDAHLSRPAALPGPAERRVTPLS